MSCNFLRVAFGVSLTVVGVSAASSTPRTVAIPELPDCRLLLELPSGVLPAGAPVPLPQTEPHTLELDRHFALEGNCAKNVESYWGGNIYLKDGRSLVVKRDGTVLFGKAGKPEVSLPTLSQSPRLVERAQRNSRL